MMPDHAAVGRGEHVEHAQGVEDRGHRGVVPGVQVRLPGRDLFPLVFIILFGQTGICFLFFFFFFL